MSGWVAVLMHFLAVAAVLAGAIAVLIVLSQGGYRPPEDRA